MRIIKCSTGRLIWAGHVDRMEECRNAFKILIWKPMRKRSLERRRRRRLDNVRMELSEIIFLRINWIR